jgi:hypothetical protein
MIFSSGKEKTLKERFGRDSANNQSLSDFLEPGAVYHAKLLADGGIVVPL